MKTVNNFNEITKLLEKNNSFLITSHKNIDGDAIGSELALYFILKKLNKKPIILNQDRLPRIYNFLPDSDKVHCLEDNYINIKNIDVGIIVDCSNFERIEENQRKKRQSGGIKESQGLSSGSTHFEPGGFFFLYALAGKPANNRRKDRNFQRGQGLHQSGRGARPQKDCQPYFPKLES